MVHHLNELAQPWLPDNHDELYVKVNWLNSGLAICKLRLLAGTFERCITRSESERNTSYSNWQKLEHRY